MMMQNKFIQGWIALLAVTFATGAAANAFTPTKAFKTGPAPALSPEISAQAFDKALGEASARGKRTVAAADKISDQALSDSFKTLRNRIIGGPTIVNGKEVEPGFAGVKSADDLQAVLKDLNDDSFYAKLSPDAQFAAAQMAPLLAFRGFFNRTIELITPTPVAHMATVAALRALGSGVVVYFPTAQWQAGIEYLTVPSNDMGPLIKTEDDVHAFLEQTLIPAVVKMKDRLDALSFSAKPVYFDNKVFYGSANFFSDRDQYVRIGEAERRAVLANAYYALSGLESLNAYYLKGLFKTVDVISDDYGYHSYFSFNPEATTAKKRVAEVRKVAASDGFLSLRDGGKAWMLAAYNSLTGAVVNNALSYRELREHQNDTETNGNLMDPRSFAAGSRMIGSGLGNLRYIVTGNGKAGRVQSAVVSNEGRVVSLQKFYENPPTSLTNLMPQPNLKTGQTGFDESAYDQTKTVTIDGKETSRTWHNFLSGRPNAWPLAEYQKVFPDIQTNEDVPNTARIMSQSWGGWLLGVPMSALVL
jgi:hypothetical protein